MTNLSSKYITLLGKIILIIDFVYRKCLRIILYLSIFATHICELFIAPPAKYPYLYPLIYAMLGFLVFFIVYAQTNLFMLRDALLSLKKSKVII